MPQTARAGVVAANGSLALSLRVSGGLPWTVSQVSPEMTNAGGTAVGVLRLNGFAVSPFVPQNDAIGGTPPIVLQPGSDELTVEWTSATPGAVGSALFIYSPGAG